MGTQLEILSSVKFDRITASTFGIRVALTHDGLDALSQFLSSMGEVQVEGDKIIVKAPSDDEKTVVKAMITADSLLKNWALTLSKSMMARYAVQPAKK